MTSLMPILSDYQEGVRNAKVYKTTNGEYGVIVYDAETDYNGFQSFETEDLAEEFAEDWVLRAGK
jgi:hypothetical protein